MAKQTFTTGQVLTAAQMTSLQQTAMGGGSATAKTASYVLVAADAGTTVAMNAAGATTITVNTGLFAAGDTVFIQNLGAGACTVTAGTATVATAGSLILPQNDAGILYFVSASSAIFYDYIQAGAVSPLTTKGDIYGFSTSDARIPIGANATVLTADSTESLGLKWATPTAAGASYTLLNSGGTSLTAAATITVSGISGADKIIVIIDGASSASASSSISLRFNSDSTNANYYNFGFGLTFTASYSVEDLTTPRGSFTSGKTELAVMGNAASSLVYGFARIEGCNSAGLKGIIYNGMAFNGSTNSTSTSAGGFYAGTSVISSVSVLSSAGNFDAGKIYIYTSA